MINIREFLNLTYYTSCADAFLKEYNQKHTKLSASQLAEKEKYARITHLRDHSEQSEPKTSFWSKF